MNQKPVNSPNPPAPGLSLGDIYYVLFRHKWKILIIAALGLLVAMVLPYAMTPPYQSEAKIMIRYVVENKSPGQTTATDSRIKSPDEGGGAIVSSEIEILTSLDLAQQVADNIGPEKILAKVGGGKDRLQAAAVIHGNLVVAVPSRSSVIQVTFQHPDPALVQPVLNDLLDSYFKRHAEVHRPVMDEFLTQETDQLRSRLVQTENALRTAKTNAGIVSIDDAKKSYSEQLSRIRLEIFAAQAEMAERQAAISEVSKAIGVKPAPVTNTVVSVTNSVPQDKMVEYRRTLNLLEGLVKKEQDLSLQYTSENAQVKGVRDQIAKLQSARDELEKSFPGLVAVGEETKRLESPSAAHLDLTSERAKVSALATKISVLTNQIAQVQRDASSLDAIEASITELQRKKELEEANYKYFSANLEQARIDEALGATRNSNISTIQEPSPPFRDSKKLDKMRMMAAVGGIAAALALAFFIELYLDRSLRRSAQIPSQLRAPLFISIPLLKLNGHGKARAKQLASASTNGHATNGADAGAVIQGEADSQVAVVANGHAGQPDFRLRMRPFFETLRDRLILYFEANNLTHKPKLVAITSCEHGSGVTSAAAGLAASLSETGEGNVLLVDMSGQQAEAHHFYRGALDCALEDALEHGKRDGAMVQENLYVVSESAQNDKLPQVLPKRFKHLIPKLRASDFDYIIFDMPPVSQISPTPRLAQFMDMVFLVVESEKTNRDVAKHAASLLAESKTHVGIVLNKTKTYVPKRLRQDL